MHSTEFTAIRKRLEKTQRELSQLLGVSLQAVHSYEQGWRAVPAHAERQILFLLALRKGLRKGKPCWTIKGCPRRIRMACPAGEFHAGHFCWFINGTLCSGKAEADWHRKMERCRSCEAFTVYEDDDLDDA